MMTRPLHGLRIGALVTLVAASMGRAGRAAAREGDASRLFDEGRALLVAGRFAEACPRLEESQRLEPRLGTQLNVAFCHERQGKLATAWLEFQEAVITARRAGDAARERFARGHVDALEPRIPWLRVRGGRGGDVAAPSLVLDAAPIAPSSWGKELPVDPGEHVVIATRDRVEYWRARIVIGESQRVDVSVPEPPASGAGAVVPSQVPVLAAAGDVPPAASLTAPASGEASFADQLVYEVGAFAGLVVVDTNRSEPEGGPTSIETTRFDADGMAQRLSCQTTTCEYDSLGSTSGLLAGVTGYVGYTLAPRASLGLRLLLGSRIEGGGLFALGPSASFLLGERLSLGPAILLGTASHAESAGVALASATDYRTIDARVRGTLGFAMGLAAELGFALIRTPSGSLMLQATPVFLYGPNGVAYALPLGAAYRWN